MRIILGDYSHRMLVLATMYRLNILGRREYFYLVTARPG